MSKIEKGIRKEQAFVLIMIVYLAGIFMGALDTGIVTPARVIIQNNFGVNDQTGIWMITIYTLAYAASIPIMGKLADKYGRKYIYLTCVFLFGLGSLFCGLSQNFGNFDLLLVARALQAIGGGGIVPVATAEFGTSFPKEKRGMALGLVGGVYGIANIFGASVGSAILDIFGKNNWQYIFYINIPITLFILVVGFIILPNTKVNALDLKKTDVFGIVTLTTMILSLLYGLRNIDFFDFGKTIVDTNVYPFLILFAVLLPVFIYVEKRAEDPVMNLSFFSDKNILITLILAFISGIILMGLIFVPQFSENALKIATGSGGYFVIILGIFAGIGAPLSGKLVDKYGPKIVLSIGFISSIVGSLFLVFVTTAYPNIGTVAVCLIIIGFGIGFTMGTPLNYMMLDNTKVEESNSALATLSLVRSIGTAIAPAIMVGFIAHAGLSVQTNVMDVLPKEIILPPLTYSQEITDEFNQLKEDPLLKDQLATVTIPDLTAMEKVAVNFNADNSDYTMPADLVERMKTSDVTTITENSKILADRMFKEKTPEIIADIESGVDQGISGIQTGSTSMDKALVGLNQGLTQLESLYAMAAPMAASLSPNMSLIDVVPGTVKVQIPESTLAQLNDIRSLSDLEAKITETRGTIASLEATQATMNDLVTKLTALKESVPSTFDAALTSYLSEIETQRDVIESVFQKTLNEGFKQVYLTVAISSLLALALLQFYNKKKRL